MGLGGLPIDEDEMGSRRGKPADLARRCEDVGWEVSLAKSGHYRVKTHNGAVFSFGSTPGDYRTVVNDESKAKKYGLHELEEKLALKRERDRLQAIENDKANGVDWEAEEKIREEEKMKTSTEGDLGYVDGIAIAEIAPAMYALKRPGEERRMVPHVQELLLVDGTIRLRCDMDGDTGPCHRTANSIQGISIHQARSHTGSYKLKAGASTPPKEKVVTVDKRGTVVKVEDYADREAQAQKIIDSGAMEAFPIEEIRSAKITTTKIDAVVASVQLHDAPGEPVMPGIFTRIIRLAEEFDELVNEAVTLTESVRVKRDELRKLIAELPDHIMTVEVKEKLETYEQLRKMIK